MNNCLRILTQPELIPFNQLFPILAQVNGLSAAASKKSTFSQKLKNFLIFVTLLIYNNTSNEKISQKNINFSKIFLCFINFFLFIFGN